VKCSNSILHDLNKALFRKENSSEQSHGQNRMTVTNTESKDANQGMHSKQSTRATVTL